MQGEYGKEQEDDGDIIIVVDGGKRPFRGRPDCHRSSAVVDNGNGSSVAAHACREN